jgi:hypothetical protein
MRDMKLYKSLTFVAVIVSTIETDDILCEVRAETERTADDRNITNQEDRLQSSLGKISRPLGDVDYDRCKTIV